MYVGVEGKLNQLLFFGTSGFYCVAATNVCMHVCTCTRQENKHNVYGLALRLVYAVTSSVPSVCCFGDFL